MKIKITWEDNDDGASRVLLQRGGEVRLWALVRDEEGNAVAGKCSLRCIVRDTRFIRWLRLAGPRRLRRALQGRPGRLMVVQPDVGRPEFVASGTPRRFLPYWLKLEATTATANESALVFVSPRANRVVSLACVLTCGIVVAYSSWLWLNLGAMPQHYLTIVGTASAVLAPVAALLAPIISTTVRRYALLDALASSALMVLAFGVAGLLLSQQQPLYVENDTPSAINLGADGHQVVVEPGAAVLVPSVSVDKAWRDALPALADGKDGTLDPRHWFRAGEYCVYRAQGDTCVELRAVALLTRLQRWLAPQGGVRIGCTAIEGLEVDALQAWKKSGSCRHDPEVEVTRSLYEHLVQSKKRNPGTPPSCAQPEGEVRIHPFRAVSPNSVARADQLTGIPLVWPTSATESLPSWRFTSTGPLAALTLNPARDAAGRICPVPYPIDCGTDKRCPGLLAPPGPLSTTLVSGQQVIGTLECPNAGSVLALRLHSRVQSLTVSDGRNKLSQFQAHPEATGAWVAWCEPPKVESSDVEPASRPSLRAELTLPEDWQPVRTWQWEIPAASQVSSLTIIVRGRGLWGELTCPASATERVLWLQEIKNASAPSVAALGNERWERYSETTLFPHWLWRCGKARTATDKLEAHYSDGAVGLVEGDKFTRAPPQACVIHPVSGQRLPGNASTVKNGKSAKALLENFSVPNCDSNRSVFARLEATP